MLSRWYHVWCAREAVFLSSRIISLGRAAAQSGIPAG
jgi:hypothetical protein